MDSLRKYHELQESGELPKTDKTPKEYRFTIVKNGVKEYYLGTLKGLLSICDKDTGEHLYQASQIVKQEELCTK